MKTKEQKKYITFTPERGFDLSFLTVKRVAEASGVSSHCVRDNIVRLLKEFPIEERIPVLEHMLTSKEMKGRGKMKVLDLDKLPASQNYLVTEFLGVSDDDIWLACKEYKRRMKQAKDPHDEFGLKEELIVQTADEVVKRNAEWLAERVDKRNPMALMRRLHEAPQDRPMWTLRLLRQHGFKKVELSVWIAADSFLSKWVENKSASLVQSMLGRLGFS